MANTSRNENFTEKMRGTQVNPLILVAVLAVAVLGAGYFFWLKPDQDAERAKRDWVSPEAQEARSPEGRKQLDPGYTKLLQDLKAKEQARRGAAAPQ